MLQLRYKSESNGIHMFKDQLEQHIKELKIEFKAGKKLAELDAKRARLREWVPRITGTIQVLEEKMTKLNQSFDSNNK